MTITPAKLIDPTDPILKKVCDPFYFEEDDSQTIFTLLRDTMCHNRGIGLAAPQIGISKQVFVMGNPDDPDNVIPVFNPQIVSLEEPIVLYEEGCLSFPGLFIKIKRAHKIRVRYAGLDGTINSISFDGMTARIFQHEYDHLAGILYQERAPKYRIDQAKQQKKIADRKRKKNEKILHTS